MDETSQVQLLEELLEQYSPTLAERPAIEALAGWMQALDFIVDFDYEDNIIGTLGSGPREIVLLGHIDTVSGQIPVRREGDLLYGRGAVDAKGPLACFTAAAALAGARPGWRVTVIGAVGEEGDSRGAKRIRDSYSENGAPDFCVIGEPSSWDHVTLGYKGSAWMEYRLERSLAHTAGQAESACEGAVRFWNTVQAQKEAFNAARGKAFDQLTTSLRQMNSSTDSFYETAVLGFNLRLPPELGVEEIYRLLIQFREDGKLTLLDGVESYRAEKNTPLVRAFLSSIRKAGGKPGFFVKTGTSDMNIVGPAWNCPILAYGPGDSALDHTPNEHIAIPEYLTAIQVLRGVLEDLQTGAVS